MNKNIPSFRTALGRARGLGSAKAGTAHWVALRVTSVALLFLTLYPLLGLMVYAAYAGRTGALEWLNSPFAATGIVLFLLVAFHHTANGLQVVIEDYVHCSIAKPTLVFAVKFLSAAFAILGTLAVAKIYLGV